MEHGWLAHWRFRALGLVLLVVLSAHAGVAGSRLAEPVMGTLGVLFVGVMVVAIGPGLRSGAAALLLAAPICVEILALGGGWSDIAGSWSHAPLLAVATLVVSHHVVRSDRADLDAVVGSVCAFVLATCTFASLYIGLEQWLPDAFHTAGDGTAQPFGRLLYFSFVAITTLGYGDVTPLHPAVRALVSLEAVLGVLYPSIIMARVVALWAEGERRPFALPRHGEGPGHYAFLTGLLAFALVTLPWLEGAPFSSLAIGLLLVVQLVGVLSSCGASRAVTRVGIGLVVVALLGRLGPGATEALGAQIGLAAQVALFLLATWTLVAWLARVQQVTREVLYAGISAYFLLGFSLGQAFQLLEVLQPGSLSGGGQTLAQGSGFDYFGFMTLTTTGFGDIVPATSAAENLAAAGACVGVFYPAILVARLVTLYRSEDPSV